MALIILLVKLTFLLIMVINCEYSFDGCSKLSNSCRLEEAFGAYTNRYETFVCNSLNTNFEMSESEMTMCKKILTTQTEVYFKLSSPEILDISLNFISLLKFIREMNGFNYFKTIRYSNLKGFDLNSSFLSDDLNKTDLAIPYNFIIYSSSFQFFLNNQLQVSCDDFLKTNITEPKSFFQTRGINDVIFENIEYSEKPICPLYFKNSHLTSIAFKYQINTFYKRNYLKFSQINNSNISVINTCIKTLWTFYNEKIDIDSNSFLNKYVFNNIRSLVLMGEINSIEKDIFKSFKELKIICLEIIYFGKLSRKGIEWILSINSDLHVNLSNRSELDLYVNQTKTITLELFSNSNHEIEKIKIFQNEDFCLFRNYPFDQLVFFQIINLKIYFSLKYTCTVQWILKYIYFYAQYPQLREYIDNDAFLDFIALNTTNISNNFEKCDFEKMINNCNRTKFEIRDDAWTINDIKEVSILIELIFILLLPIVCLCGLISNVMIIFTLSLKENEKDLKKVHYPYLRMVCVSNIVVLIIKILSPIYECQSHQGIFCSSIHKSLFAQYYKIIFGEFLCAVFSMISNFGYVGFSICRLSLVGKDHSKLIKFISELPMSYYILVSTIMSVALSVVKIFRFQVNEFDPDQNYPIPFDRSFNNMFSPNFATKARVINVLNAVSDITNYFLFILVNVILDIVLVMKLKKTLSEKLNSDVEKTTQAVFRIIILVVSFALFSIILKFPASLKSIFDSIHLNNDLIALFADKHIDYLYEWFCVYARFCPTYDKLASILFTISISANIFFYYLFDKNFKFGLKIAISKLINKKEKHLDYVKSLEESRKKT